MPPRKSGKKNTTNESDGSTYLIHYPVSDINEDISLLGGLAYIKQRVKLFTKYIQESLEDPKLAELKQGRILLKGPPGTGKTTVGKILAKMVGADLYIVSISQLVSSFLGETQKNFASALAYLKAIAKENEKGVIFFLDEFDALARSRVLRNDSSEMQRLVNAILQEFDQISLKDKIFILAATNHERILDRAVWRRFDEVWVFNLPTKTELKDIVMTLVRNNTPDKFSLDIGKLVDELDDYSGADIERLVKEGLFRVYFEGNQLVTTDLLLDILKEGAIRSTQSLIIEAESNSKSVVGLNHGEMSTSAVQIYSFRPASREEFQGPLMVAIRDPDIYQRLETACHSLQEIPLSTRQLLISLTNGGLLLEKEPVKLLQSLSSMN